MIPVPLVFIDIPGGTLRLAAQELQTGGAKNYDEQIIAHAGTSVQPQPKLWFPATSAKPTRTLPELLGKRSYVMENAQKKSRRCRRLLS
jgi:hypothetical protein